MAGRSASGMRHLDGAVLMSATPMNHMRRGMASAYVREFQGTRGPRGPPVAGSASPVTRSWEARALHNLGYVHLRAGRLDEAEHLTAQCGRDADGRGGWTLEALWAEQNLGEIAYARGALPAAMAALDKVAAGYADAGHHRPHLAVVRCMVLLAAGLGAEAVDVVDEVLEARDASLAWDVATLEQWGAAARLDQMALDDAVAHAVRAHRAFRRIGSAELGGAGASGRRARSGATGRPRRRLAAEAVAVAEGLDAERADEAPVALIVASRLEPDRRPELLDRAAAYRVRSTSLVRASGWLATGLARAAGRARGVLRACGSGLDALDDHRRLLGSTELRALATAHGVELAELALRHAVDRPRDLLQWSERWRSTALAQPPVTRGTPPPWSRSPHCVTSPVGWCSPGPRASRPICREGARPAGAAGPCRAPRARRIR